MACKINLSKCKKFCFLPLIILSVGIFIIPYQPAVAIPPVWPGAFNLNDGGVPGAGLPTSAVTVSVTDGLAAGAGSITVRITSSLDSNGFDLTLIETGPGTGVFINTNLALMSDNALSITSSSITITVFDDSAPLPVPQTLPLPPILIVSDSDTAGITPTFTETGPDTNLYTATINFDIATDAPTNTLAGVPGNIFTVADLGGGNLVHGFINPNPNTGKGAILAEVGGTVIATYQGDSDSFVVGANPGAGRGSGGLVKPGMVVDTPSSGGNGCNSDCTPPTLGIHNLNRIVSNGFSFNNNPADVDLFYTPYPLIITNVGQENIVVLKIFENGGIQNIEHVGLAFGLGQGQSFGESKATINLDRTFYGTEKTSLYDPENVFDKVKIVTSIESCSISGPLCLVVTIHFMFREELEFNMVGTEIWDSNKNSWQNYYNHGIEIEGDSLNPPKTVMVAFGEKDMRGLYELTQIDKKKHLWVDEFGNIYEDKGNNRFDRIFSAQQKIAFDKQTTHGCDRNCNWFNEYKLNQALLAEITLKDLLGGKIMGGESPKESFSYSFHITNRAEDLELQKLIVLEKIKAEKLAETLFNFRD